jgi:hypothetical protein
MEKKALIGQINDYFRKQHENRKTMSFDEVVEYNKNKHPEFEILLEQAKDMKIESTFWYLQKKYD